MTDEAPKKRTKTRYRLSDTWCSKQKPEQKPVKYFDSQCPGLYLQVYPSGIKSFGYCACTRTGYQWITLGRFAALEYPGQTRATYNVEKARREVDEMRARAKQGKDVRGELTKERNPHRFSNLVDNYRQNHYPTIKPSTRAGYDSVLEGHILPTFGKKAVIEVTYEDVARFHNGLVQEGKKALANRARALLSGLFNHAIRLKWIPSTHNPVTLVGQAHERPRDRVVRPSEYQAIGQAIRDMRLDGSMSSVVSDAILFCAFSGLRRSEVLGLEWSDLNREAGTMTIREHKRSKTMGHMVLPLNPQLLTIVNQREAEEAAREASQKGYQRPGLIFASSVTGGIQTGIGKSLDRLLAKAELIEEPKITLHDLRRTFMTTCCELGFPASVGDQLLGHSLGKIRDTYLIPQVRGLMAEASARTADRIAEMMGHG